MHDLELPDHDDSDLALAEVADTVAVPDTEASVEAGEGEGDGGAKVFRGAHTSRDPKDIIKRVREFDYVVVNRDGALDEAVDQVLSIIKAEKCRVNWTPVEI